ncbi:MAG TPA: YjbF family lipoprotein [Crenalkalicoccus sp.]|jgi:hypothetical protein|nr:YjbF family lipoprotein [Crenalkalicoccus sp.]
MRVALALLLLLGGCGDSPWGAVSDRVGELIRPPAAEDPPPAADRALSVTLGRRRAQVALLQELGERRLWRSPGGIVIATEGVRVVATSGLSQVLAATRFEEPDPLARPATLLEGAATAHRLVDLMTSRRDPAGMRFGVQVTCRLSADPTPEPGVLAVEEHCRAGRLGRFTNRFWVEEGGGWLRSEQWIGPGLPMLALEPVGPEPAEGGE